MKVDGIRRIYLPIAVFCCVAVLPRHCSADTCEPFPDNSHCHNEYNCVYGCQGNRRKILSSTPVYDCNHATTKYVATVVNNLQSKKCQDTDLIDLYNNNANFTVSSCDQSASAFASCGNRTPYKLSIVVGYNVWLILWVCLFGIVYLLPSQAKIAKTEQARDERRDFQERKPTSYPERDSSVTSRFTNVAFKL